MATYNVGILGAFTGKVGPVVGVNWRGKNVMRSLPKKSGHIPTEAQLQQRSKFAVVTKFITPIKSVLSVYFGNPSGARSKYNMATSYHLKEAVIETPEGFAMMYNKVLITKGDLQAMATAELLVETGNLLHLDWINNSGQGKAFADDRPIVVIFSEELQLFEIFEPEVTRADSTVTLTVQPVFLGSEVQCWAGFVNNAKNLASLSVYLGAQTII